MIEYVQGKKYQLVRPHACQLVHVRPGYTITSESVFLYRHHWLVIKAGYAWDGPSGPTFDTQSFMRGSLVHDALYGLIRAGLLGAEYRGDADRELYRICREDGMGWLRAKWVYLAVSLFGDGAAVRHEPIYRAGRG